MSATKKGLKFRLLRALNYIFIKRLNLHVLCPKTVLPAWEYLESNHLSCSLLEVKTSLHTFAEQCSKGSEEVP